MIRYSLLPAVFALTVIIFAVRQPEMQIFNVRMFLAVINNAVRNAVSCFLLGVAQVCVHGDAIK
jgi:hypothetical protein